MNGNFAFGAADANDMWLSVRGNGFGLSWLSLCC